MIKDVHTRHCCSKHGCKYGDEDCTVVNGLAPGEFTCEICEDEKEDMLMDGLYFEDDDRYKEIVAFITGEGEESFRAALEHLSATMVKDHGAVGIQFLINVVELMVESIGLEMDDKDLKSLEALRALKKIMDLLS